MSRKPIKRQAKSVPLTETAIRKALPKASEYKISDSRGLHILITPAHSKLWRINYRFDGKQRTYREFDGPYPDVSLDDARAELVWVKQQIKLGKDPIQEKKKLREANKAKKNEIFENIATTFLEEYQKKVTKKQHQKTKSMVEKCINPHIGKMVCSEIKPIHVLQAAKVKEEEGKTYTAHKIVEVIGQILERAKLDSIIQYNVAHGVSKALKKHKTKHYAAIVVPEQIGELLCNIDLYKGYSPVIPFYLKMMPYVFTRPTELRLAAWEEFDFEQMLWTIPVERMKMGEVDHLVPIPKQLAALLMDLYKISGNNKYLFPSSRSRNRVISDNGVLIALRSLGHPHGHLLGACPILAMLKHFDQCKADA